ncbi:DUF2946 family protein [Bradyrhizobium sp. STM 3809]|uniref:DUF2946 family protein n=1 Tax=Bradyrhizobium sp. STM 3809 TaxID=551936 RepID=UPI0002405A89|nr:DUF2946 family protein [Bradyrhizobium sp. STM 3809]CCD99299.1 conserved exported hypothetical protein [Bradyrhizobium sp. STM 3809]
MSWFRANIRDVSRLALFALLLQFALAFGHVHGSAGQAADGGITVAERHTGPAPASQDPDQQPAADSCAICAVMAMAQSILLSPPPALDLPTAVDIRPLKTIAESFDVVVIGTAFQPRAPPIA